MTAPPGVPGPATPLRPGDPSTLGPYVLRGRLGQGGMGTVYLGRRVDGALDGAPAPWVAIKMIRTDFATDGEFRSRFRREAESARRVARFCTAAVVDADPDGPLPYLVTEYVEGPTLSKAVASGGPMRSADLEQLAVSVATALTAIHNAGVVHRDLTPSNVLLSPVGPKVIDFGVSRAVDAVTMARESQRIGTPGFMSPEQIAGEEVTAAADVFAWGGIVVYAGTGRLPFGEGPTEAVLYRVIHAEPAMDGLDPGLRAIVERAMHKDPHRRPTAQALLMHLVGQTAPAGAPGVRASVPADEQATARVAIAPAPAPAKPRRTPKPKPGAKPTSTTPPKTAQPAAAPWPPSEPAPKPARPVKPAKRAKPPKTPAPAGDGSRRTRRLVAAGAAVAVLAGGGIAAALLAGGGSSPSSSTAGTATDRALASRRTAAAANDIRATNPALAARLSLAAYRAQATPEATRALLLSFMAGAAIRVPTPTTVTDGVAVRSDGKLLASAGTDGTARLTDLSSPAGPTTVATLPSRGGAINGVAFNPAGNLLATAGSDNGVVLWNVADPAHPVRLSILLGHISPVNAVAFSPDGTVLASASDDRTARLWDVRTPSHPVFLESAAGHLGPVTDVAFAPTGHLAATASVDGKTRVWDVTNPKMPTLLATLAGHDGAVDTVVFSRDGHTLVTGGDDDTARLWNVTDPGHPTAGAVLTDHRARVTAAVFVGGLLATSSLDGTVDVYGPAGGGTGGGTGGGAGGVAGTSKPSLLLTLPDVTSGGITTLTTTADGTTLADGGGDGSARVRALDPTKLAASACANPTNRLSPADWHRYLPGVPVPTAC